MAMFSTKRYLLVRNLMAITAPQSLANISTGRESYQANHYDTLGIPKSSTQGEIKAAYYRLSMAYHPDKNQGSETAAIRFREITQAYEVLSNFRLRRLYDKGIIHTAGSKYAHRAQEDIVYDTEPQREDDPSTKFYKSRFSKSKVPDSKGQTPIFNFDEWSRQHYGATFERRQASKAKSCRKATEEKYGILMLQKQIVMAALFGLVIIAYCTFSKESYDTPKQIPNRLSNEKNQKEKDRAT